MSAHKLHKLSLNRAPLLLRHILVDVVTSVELNTPEKTKYFIPSQIKGDLLDEYKESLDWIEKYYSTIRKHKTLGKIGTDLLPLAHLVDIKIEATDEQLVNAASKLSRIKDPYFKNLSMTFHRLLGAKKSDVNPIEIDQGIPVDREMVKLINFNPRTETEVLANALFTETWLNYDELFDEVDAMKYKKRYDLLKSRDCVANYDFELITELKHVAQLAGASAIYDIKQQSASVYYGYDIDISDEQDSIIDMFQRCYDMSYKLYSAFIEAELFELAQLVVLQGHRQRYLVSTNSRALNTHKYSKSELIEKMIELATDKHPTLLENASQ